MHAAASPSGSWSISITSSFLRSENVKSSSCVKSQPIIIGEATSAQSDMCVYCSFGARRDPLNPFHAILPTHSVSGSLNEPGFE